ncbi:MAG TPA: substrate-binding domain-containing protein, partial [Deinococcales bacterium]|nr:substrate-binding domain-containing protein [Deinococcales bacterium]
RHGDHREGGGYDAARDLLSLPAASRPTALFVGNNEMAIGAMRAVRDLGLSIPRDVSVVSFDDSRWAALIDPALTVVAQPTYELGRTACELLISQLGRKRPQATRQVRLGTELIVRSSTAAPRGAGGTV